VDELDGAGFARLTERHRRELRAHCYRMVGSLVESEDLVQETFLRAWRSRATYEGRASVRGWLYAIATNVCLEVLARRPRRVLPHETGAAAGPGMTAVPAPVDRPWLEPYPDDLLDAVPDPATGPESAAVAAETIELAFLAAIQHLSPRQRAVLVLRDVVGRSAAETAEALGISVPAAKSALERARATLRQHLPPGRAEWAPEVQPNARERVLLQRYLDAHADKDADALAAVLREDVRVSFPPLPLWVRGRESVIEGTRRFADPGTYRYLPLRSNRQPAAAVYLRRPGEQWFALIALEVLRIERDLIAEIVDFSDPAVLAATGLPARL
jgi:RNA polymerase sigma-70 factor (ECF subfamily)